MLNDCVEDNPTVPPTHETEEVGAGEWPRYPRWLVGPVGRVRNQIVRHSIIDKPVTIALTGDGTRDHLGGG
jgi:hypothetical protein